MVKDQQVRRLIELTVIQKSISTAAAMAGMCERTARKYLGIGKLPSECRMDHTWRTRVDPFEDVWDEIRSKLELFPGLQGVTLFGDLQKRYPGRFSDGQLRSLQRKIKRWRATQGPMREVFFAQEHHPGDLGASDFCHMSGLGVTISGQPFPHLLYHFVLTYSNWETGSICFSESFESLSEGLQKGLWILGGVPKRHRTDSVTAAVRKPDSPEEFTRAYQGLLRHYSLDGEKTNARRPNENGDVEQRHNRTRTAIDQALMLRGSRDFASRDEYEEFLRGMFGELNAGRQTRLKEELAVLHALPSSKLDSGSRVDVRVGPSSTIRVKHNTYSVPSRLIGERVQVRLYAEHLELWYAQKLLERIERLRGENRHKIDYRHIIDWLVRKPGAFANFKYRDDMFPTSRFRMAYDVLKESMPNRAEREYVRILHLAARHSETGVDDALRLLLGSEETLSADKVESICSSGMHVPPVTEVMIRMVDLSAYDELLEVSRGASAAADPTAAICCERVA